MNILSLDLATTTGWAFNQHSMNGGVWDLSQKKGSSAGMRLIKLRSFLQDFLDTVGTIDLIVYEKPAGRFINGVVSVAELVSTVLLFCEDNKINYTSYRPTEVKKWATGKGNSNKEVMLAEAKRRWPSIQIIDDNQADAMLMLAMAQKDF